MNSSTVHSSKIVKRWLDEMVSPLKDLIRADQPVSMIGIRRGGVDVGRYLLSKLQGDHLVLDPTLGELNISFYRDDFSTIGLHPQVGPSHVPFDVEGQHIVLVDDVLATGRTVRAAMNEIFDYGRPSRISLVVLVQRAGHELPIRADVVGVNLDVQASQYIHLDASSWQVNIGEKG
ncbi:MAG: bifunctional pyr operon transcriptional regulator/uracil phosphoribosyltransferase PyrR [Granulosicoccus sp.]|nr:bifunctional pyr operon transcriptional regulator/uracil phosphoribosyltransferase PyrR [Granulosicoccus sp.]